MTQNEQERICFYRRKGVGYKRISALMKLPVDTVKAYCRRHPEMDDPDICLCCGVPLLHTPHKKRKLFCSDACRMRWWNRHPDAVERKAYYTLICVFCGTPFMSYGNAHRKYCSRRCYAAARLHGVRA